MNQDTSSVNLLVYGALQRQFRNAIITYLRERFITTYPDAWLVQLRRPFRLEEWESVVTAAEQAADSTLVNAKHDDEFDYLSINHFFNLFDVHWKFLIPRGLSDSITMSRKRELLAFLREIKVVRDPLSHPSTADIDVLDAVRVLGSARRALEILDLPAARALKVLEGDAVAMASMVNETRGASRDPISGVDRFPSPLAPLVGRERERAAVATHMTSHRLVTIVGTGGVGKTRLAIAVADDLRKDGNNHAVLVLLEEARSAAEVVPLIATALAVPRDTSDDSFAKLVKRIANERLVLLLDNLEHVINARQDLHRLLEACAHLRVLATSRQPLDVDGEQVFRLQPFTLPDSHDLPHPDDFAHLPAVALFIDRARASDPTFSLNHTNAYSIVDICRRVDGLPLAIALVAARVGFLSPGEILQRRESDPGFPARADGVGRHRSLRATVQWSYDLLTGDVQTAFRQFGVFVGGCTLDAARLIVSSTLDREVSTDDVIEELARQSLIERSRSGRISMLETIRDFAVETLSAAGEKPTAELAHARYFAVLCANRDAENTDSLAGEVGNLSAVLDRIQTPLADDDACLRIAADVADVLAIWLDDPFEQLWDVILRCAQATPATRRDALLAAVDPPRMSLLHWKRGIAAFDAWGDHENAAFAMTMVVEWRDAELTTTDIAEFGGRLSTLVVDGGNSSTEHASALTKLANLVLRQASDDMPSRVASAVQWFKAAMRVYERLEAEPLLDDWLGEPIDALMSEGEYKAAQEITLALPRPQYAGGYATFWSDARRSTGVARPNERDRAP